MAEQIQHVRQVRKAGTAPVDTEVVEERRAVATEPRAGGQNIAARVVWFIAGILLTLLAFRFVLALLGANPGNAFANFIYTTSHPFVAPFFGLFNYDLRYGISRFETFTLIAMAVYALIAFAIARLLTINRPAAERY